MVQMGKGLGARGQAASPHPVRGVGLVEQMPAQGCLPGRRTVPSLPLTFGVGSPFGS